MATRKQFLTMSVLPLRSNSLFGEYRQSGGQVLSGCMDIGSSQLPWKSISR